MGKKVSKKVAETITFAYSVVDAVTRWVVSVHPTLEQAEAALSRYVQDMVEGGGTPRATSPYQAVGSGGRIPQLVVAQTVDARARSLYEGPLMLARGKGAKMAPQRPRARQRVKRARKSA